MTDQRRAKMTIGAIAQGVRPFDPRFDAASDDEKARQAAHIMAESKPAREMEALRAQNEDLRKAQVPEGWKLVPIKPTDEMLNVMHDKIRILCLVDAQEASIQNDVEVWQAMLNVAPSPTSKVPA